MTSEKKSLTELSEKHKVPGVNLEDFEIEEKILRIIPFDLMQKNRSIPISKVENTLIVGMVDPSSIYAIDELTFLTGYKIEACVVTEEDLQNTFEKYSSILNPPPSQSFPPPQKYDPEEEEDWEIVDIEGHTESPVVRLVELILLDAIKKEASEIHIEPYEDELWVRYRIDGVLHQMMKPPYKLRNAIFARIKVMAQLDIAERRLPQEGRIKIKVGEEQQVDFHIISIPTITGEKFLLRLHHSRDDSSLMLENLGMDEGQIRLYLKALMKRRGLVLVTGPVRSGKKTTLYSTLSKLQSTELSISTIEREVHRSLLGLQQTQLHEAIGLYPSSLLRSILQQQPDVIMIDGMEDLETAELVTQAAIRQQLMLSAFHTIDTTSVLFRLQSMGMAPYLIASTITIVVAQRLGRRLCQHCKKQSPPPKQTLVNAGVPPKDIDSFQFYQADGCEHCHGTGYKGMVPFFEVMPLTEEVKQLFLSGAEKAKVRELSIRTGMKTLRQSALDKLKQGLTTLEEVLSHTSSD